MSKGFTNAVIQGVLGRDPETRSTPSGAKVCNFSLAVEHGFGEKISTDWHNVVAWKERADFAEKYLKKGKAVAVSGELQNRSWDDKTTGAKRTVTELVADRIQFADLGGPKSEGQSRTTAPATRQQTTPAPRAAAPDPFDDDPDAIPF